VLLPKLGKHSGLGIASFLIALLVGGLDVMLAIVIVTQIARSAKPPTQTGYGASYSSMQDRLRDNVLAGGMAMICLNCLSVPICLVGVGLGVVGLIAQRGQNHLFTWIGVLGNGVVIVGVIGLYILGTLAGP
jgi:hypothetical protein